MRRHLATQAVFVGAALLLAGCAAVLVMALGLASGPIVLVLRMLPFVVVGVLAGPA